MFKNEDINTLKFEIYITLVILILFFVMLLLLFTGMVYTKFFGIVINSAGGYFYIPFFIAMIIITPIEIVHTDNMYKYIKNNNIKMLKKINSMKYAILCVFFAGLVTGLLLIFIHDSIKKI